MAVLTAFVVVAGVWTTAAAGIPEESRLVRREVHGHLAAGALAEGGAASPIASPAAVTVQSSGLQDQTWTCAASETYFHAAARCQDVGVYDRFEYDYFPDSTPCGCKCCRRPVKALWQCYPKYDESRNESWRWCQDVGVRDGWEYRLFHRVLGAGKSMCGCDCCRRSIEVCPGFVNITKYGAFVATKQDPDGLMSYESTNESEAKLLSMFYVRESKQWKLVDKRTPKHEFVCASPHSIDSNCPSRASGMWQCGEVEDDAPTKKNMTVESACPWAFTVKGAEGDAPNQMGSFVVTNIQAQKSHGWRQTWQNAMGNYIYYKESVQKWLIGDSWDSAIAPVQCLGNSSAMTCPHTCETWQVESLRTPGTSLQKKRLVKHGDCPTQIYLAGSRLTGMLSMFGQYSFAGYGGLENAGRPLYRHKNGHYLYYWFPTRNWRVGTFYNESLANITSRENIYDFCPDKMGAWNAWVNGQWSEKHFVFAENAAEDCPPEVMISGHPQSTYQLKYGIFRQTGQKTKALEYDERPVYKNPYTGEYLFYSTDTQAWHVGALGQSGTSKIRSTPYEAQRCPTKATDWSALFPGNGKWLNSFFIRAVPACSSAYRVSAAKNVASKYLGVFGRIETQLSGFQMGRPLYRNADGLWLYYWNVTKDWHVGTSYSVLGADKLGSLKLQDAACPDYATHWTAKGAAATGATDILVSALADETLPDIVPRKKIKIPEPTLKPEEVFVVQSAEREFRSRTEIRRRRHGRVESQRIDTQKGVKRLCLSDVNGEFRVRLCHGAASTAKDQSWVYSSVDLSLRLLNSTKCVTNNKGDVTSSTCSTPPAPAQRWELGANGLIQWAPDKKKCLRMSADGFKPESPLITVKCNVNDIFQRWH